MIECRRPIEDWEIPYLQALGAAVRRLREDAGLSRRILAFCAQVSDTQIKRIECATRRTRSSTLTLIVDVFAEAYDWDDASAFAVLEDLIATAGPALAPESEHAGRVKRRRAKRFARKQRQLALAEQIARPLAQQLAREYASEYIQRWRWLYGNSGYRRSP